MGKISIRPILILAAFAGCAAVEHNPEPQTAETPVPVEVGASENPRSGEDADDGPSSVADADRSAMIAPSEPSRYAGRPVSFDLKDADIRNVLRLIGDVGGLSIVATSDVEGKVTMQISEMPWDAVLDAILRALNLGSRKTNGVIRVSTLKRLREEDEEAKAAFTSYRQQKPDDTRPAYYLGMYALAAGDHGNAKTLFDEARKGTTHTADYARAYHALLANQDRDPDGPQLAAEAYKTAPNETLKAKLQPLANLYAGAGTEDASGRTQKWVDFRAVVNTEFDSNAALAPFSIAAATPPATPPAASRRPSAEPTIRLIIPGTSERLVKRT